MDEALDYYPYGGIRTDRRAGPFTERVKYAGHEFDVGTGLSYMGARYYDSSIGRFLSQDPVASFIPEKLIIDPQQLNEYAYARNNPLVNIDPDGLDSHVFYDPKNFSKQAQSQSDSLASKYSTPVHMTPITSEKQFTDAWNSMGKDGTSIDGVSLMFHGSSDAITIDADKGEYMTIYQDGKTLLGNSATYLGGLDRKQTSEINLMTCQGGNCRFLDERREVHGRSEQHDCQRMGRQVKL